MTRHRFARVYPIDARTSRTLTDPLFESLDGVGLALGFDFNVAAWNVSHPAVHALADGGFLREKTEANALDRPDDHVSPAKPHNLRWEL